MQDQTKTDLKRLGQISRDVQAKHYERVTLAARVLNDTDWLAEFHNGDQDKAAESLGEQYFSDIVDFIPLAKLVAIFRQFPLESTWKEYRYNLQAMEALFDEQRTKDRKADAKPQKRATLAELNDRDEEIAKLQKTIAKLNDRIGQLKEENAKLRGELELARREAVAA